MKVLPVEELKKSWEAGGAGWQRVDVRSATEYAAGHVPGARNIPLEQIEARLGDVDTNAPVVLICKSGMRARMAAGFLQQSRENVMVLDGGTNAWAEAGLPLVVHRATRWSLERQVRLVAGVLTVLGVALAVTVNMRWIYFSGIVGLGLTFAGLTDICAMGVVLGKMPWNRARQSKVPRTEGPTPDAQVPTAGSRHT